MWGPGCSLLPALIGCGGANASSPQGFAGRLAQNDSELRSAIDAWRAGGDPPSSAPPADVVDNAAELQDMVDRPGDHPNLAVRVLPVLGGALRGEVNRLYRARRALLRLSAGSRHRD